MNNLISFERYREMIRLSASSFPMNEGLMDKVREKISTSYVDKILDDEIELGKQIEEKIKTTVSELEDICKQIKVKDEEGSKFKKALNEIFDNINKTSFDTLSLLGDSNIDFSGFKKYAVMANVINLSVLLSPIKNALILRNAYKYFVNLIKMTLRKDLVMLLINFDQFQNMVLQHSTETEQNAKIQAELQRQFGSIETLYTKALLDTVGNKHKGLMDKVKKAMDIEKQRIEALDKSNPMRDFFANQYDNIYKVTADSLKNYINDDNQKMLESTKNNVSKFAHGDEKLGVYAELLISVAEEKAMKTSIEIHTNFLKLADVFKLSNQKKLVEMMQKAEKEYQDEISKKESARTKQAEEKLKRDMVDFITDEGKKILKGISSFEDYDKLSGEVSKGDITMKKKDLVQQYLQSVSHVPSYLKVVVAYPKYDINYDKSYLSYLDMIVTKLSKAFTKNKSGDGSIDFDKLDDKEGEKLIVRKFKSSRAKQALKIISDEIVEFDYELLLDKINNMSRNNTLNGKAYDDFIEAFDYMKKYKENGYEHIKEKKSED